MASLPYPCRPPNSFHRTHSKFVCASPPTDFTEFTEASGVEEPPTDFTEYTEASGVEEPPTDAHRCTQMVRLRKFSHGIHRIHRSFWRRRASHRFHRIHRFFFSASRFCVFREFCGKIVCWLRGYGIPAIPTQPSKFLPQNPFQVCLRKSSHRFHRIHRSFWRRRASHRCAQMHTDG